MDEQVIVQQYRTLLRKAQEYFSGLRDFPQVGNKRLWQPYFQKTFDIYTQLWRFQQEHRAILEKKERCGLKRWEIGDIAAKIAQLYYHYYLRTSNVKYLNESFVFYEAIRSRQYFHNVINEEQAVLYNRKLRYYARFIVVCLLLNKRELVVQLFKELKDSVAVYASHFPKEGTDVADWQIVLTELEAFLKADSSVVIGSQLDNLSYRLLLPTSSTVGSSSSTSNSGSPQPGTSSGSPTVAQQRSVPMQLGDAILVGNKKKQVKFSELTLDMFRMMQSLEFEVDRRREKRNCRKNMLYRPTVADVMFVLSNALLETEPNSAILLYLAADTSADEAGLLLASKRTPPKPQATTTSTQQLGEQLSQIKVVDDPSTLTLDDIRPFTRKPMFIIAESENSQCLRPTSNSRFGEPVVVLMAPPKSPAAWSDANKQGSMLTHFLTSPVSAFILLSQTSTSATTTSNTGSSFNPESIKISVEASKSMAEAIDVAFEKITKILTDENSKTDPAILTFLENEVARSFLLRFVFCSLAIRNITQQTDQVPSIYPQIQEATLQEINSQVVEPLLAQLQSVLQASN